MKIYPEERGGGAPAGTGPKVLVPLVPRIFQRSSGWLYTGEAWVQTLDVLGRRDSDVSMAAVINNNRYLDEGVSCLVSIRSAWKVL